MELAAGTMVTDKVQLRKPLGEGGMGAVWVADHLTLDMQVAVKFIHADLVETSPELLQRFESEARAAARIKSRHVVQVFDHGVTDDGTPYIVMEKLEGNTLAEWLELEKRLSLHDTATIVSDVASALHKAHKSGIVHRDIKPDNIFIVDDDDEPYVKVLDFGIAKKAATPGVRRVTAIGEMMGTPQYMSPEQAMSAADVDERADLWALSVVAYETLTGQLPFSGDTLGQVVMAVSRGDFPAASERLQVPRDLDAWFARAFHKNQDHRFQTALELTSQLSQIVDSASSSQQLRPLDSIEPEDEQEPRSAIPVEGTMASAEMVTADTLAGASSDDVFVGRPLTLPSATADTGGSDTQPGGGRSVAPNKPLPELELDLDAGRHRGKAVAASQHRQPAASKRRQRERAADQPQQQRVKPQASRAERPDALATRGAAARRPRPRNMHREAPRRTTASSAPTTDGLPRATASDLRSYRDVAIVLVVVLVVIVAMPFFDAQGQAHIAAKLGDAAAVPFSVLAVGLAVVGVKVWTRASDSGAALLLSGGGLVLLGAVMGLAALSHAKPDLGLGELAETVDLIGSVAATTVPLGFSIHGARGGLDELQTKRATGYGSVLLVMSLIGLVAAYQLGTQAVRALLG